MRCAFLLCALHIRRVSPAYVELRLRAPSGDFTTEGVRLFEHAAGRDGITPLDARLLASNGYPRPSRLRKVASAGLPLISPIRSATRPPLPP